MSLKTTILKKKLAKQGGIVDAFLVEQIYAHISQLVNEEHNDIATKTRKEFETNVNKQVANIQAIGRKIMVNMSADDVENQQAMMRLVTNVRNDITAFKESSIAIAEIQSKEIIQRAQNKVDEIIKNADAFKGEPGIAGKPGEKGDDGSSDKPNQVVEKINTAKNKVKMSSVEGLLDKLDAIKKLARGSGGGKSGGGMGAPQHETFAITDSTTSVTTAFTIAAGGNALFKATYQGQELDKDDHFTVGGNNKTITFSAAVQAQLSNGTVFSVTYIRG